MLSGKDGLALPEGWKPNPEWFYDPNPRKPAAPVESEPGQPGKSGGYRSGLTAARGSDVTPAAPPALPVVQPEPGDRADRVQCIVCSTYVPESRIEPVVAAAVAAVRADTEAALALHTGLHQCVGGSWYSDNDPTYHGTVARHTPCPTAAALRGLS